MKAEHLVAFCTIAKYKNVTKAAYALRTSQPGLSRQLAALQNSVGDILYERTAYGIELTPAGEALLPYACAVAQTLSQAKSFLDFNADQESIVLNIGISLSLVPIVTPKLIQRMNELNREGSSLKLNLTEGYGEHLIEKLFQRQLDICFVIEPITPIPIDLTATIFSDNLIGCFLPTTHELATHAYTSINKLKNETLLLNNSLSPIYQRIKARLDKNQINPNSLVELSGPTAVLSAVTQNLGIGIGLSSYHHHLPLIDTIKFIQLEESGFNIPSIKVTYDLSTIAPAKRIAIEHISNI